MTRVGCLPAASSFQSRDKPALSRKLKGRPQQCRRGLFPRRSPTVEQVCGDQEVGHLVTYPYPGCPQPDQAETCCRRKRSSSRCRRSTTLSGTGPVTVIYCLPVACERFLHRFRVHKDTL